MNREELEKEAEDNKPPYAFCALDTNCELWKDGYIKGAEPREKRIEELEKENAELQEEIGKKQHLADVRLEQELETYQKLHIKSREKLDTEIAFDEVRDQLAQAKKLLADIIKFQPYVNRDTMFLTVGNDWKEVIHKTEQFLKEVEE